jgi:hypothetical protein
MPNQQQGRSSRTKRVNRRKAPPKGDSVAQYTSDAWSLAKRTAYGLNEIRKLINIETKIFDTASASSPDNAGTVIPLNLIAQGVDFQNRVGDSLKMQKLEFNFRITIGSGTKTFVRMMVLRDLDNQGATPAVTDILQSADILAPKKYLNQDRFSVLVDEISSLNSVSIPNQVSEYDMAHEGHIKFLGNTAAAASMGKGSLFLLLLSNESAVNAPSVGYWSRIYFTDD